MRKQRTFVAQIARPSWYVILVVCSTALADETNSHGLTIESNLIHLRSGADQEWSDFPEITAGSRFDKPFDSKANSVEFTLFVRQQDVKQGWDVSLNRKKLGELTRDENDLVVAFAIPARMLLDGQNVLSIGPAPGSKSASDDIRVGQIEMVFGTVHSTLHESSIEIEVIDADRNDTLPCRITVLNEQGSLQTFGFEPSKHLAARPGIAYTSNGHAKLGLPVGRYTITAGRGFEYSLAEKPVTTTRGETSSCKLTIRREVPTLGYVACDPHVHTLTHSGHGDATIEERMVTLAGEGIELPVATDHNKHIDYERAAKDCDVRQYFTPVVGNEVTTARGHFNIFPVSPGARLVEHTQTDWGRLFDDVFQDGEARVAILNHARDLHNNVRPFGPAVHNSLVGENLAGWPLRFNAMEIINSGATQSEPLQLFHDWMALLNRGLIVTPIGSSDSHDVGRYIVGQGRTYIRCDDREPGNLSVTTAVENLVRGHVMVSYGLIAELTVNQHFHSGDLVSIGKSEHLQIDIRVLGPHWVQADRLQLFSNGNLIRESTISNADDSLPTGVKWEQTWILPIATHDVHLVALATGKGIQIPSWKMAKPYQPVSPDGEFTSMGCSGAIWVDVDQDGKPTAAREYASHLVASAANDRSRLINDLSDYDRAVALQTAHLLHTSGVDLRSASLTNVLRSGSDIVQSAFQDYRTSLRDQAVAK